MPGPAMPRSWSRCPCAPARVEVRRSTWFSPALAKAARRSCSRSSRAVARESSGNRRARRNRRGRVCGYPVVARRDSATSRSSLTPASDTRTSSRVNRSRSNGSARQAGDYGVVIDDDLVAAVERKSLDNLVHGLIDGSIQYQLADLAVVGSVRGRRRRPILEVVQDRTHGSGVGRRSSRSRAGAISHGADRVL